MTRLATLLAVLMACPAAAFDKAACDPLYKQWAGLSVQKDKSSWEYKDQAYKLEQELAAKKCPRVTSKLVNDCERDKALSKTPGSFAKVSPDCAATDYTMMPDARFTDPGSKPLPPESKACQDLKAQVKQCQDQRKHIVMDFGDCTAPYKDDLIRNKCRGFENGKTSADIEACNKWYRAWQQEMSRSRGTSKWADELKRKWDACK